MKLYVYVNQEGYWTVQTFGGKVLFCGVIADDGEMAWDACVELPDAIESAIRRAWVNKKVETVQYTPETMRVSL